MDLFKLGLRNVLGITLPGALVVFIFFYVLFSTTFALNQPLIIFAWTKDQQFLILVALFLISYVLGSLMRLNAADKVDEKSAKHHLDKFNKDKGTLGISDKQEFERARQQLLKGNQDVSIPEGFDKWIWRTERFHTQYGNS